MGPHAWCGALRSPVAPLHCVPQLEILLPHERVQLGGDRSGQLPHPDDLLHVGEILESIGRRHPGGKLQLDHSGEREQGNSRTALRRVRGIGKRNRLWFAVARIGSGQHDIDIDAVLGVSTLYSRNGGPLQATYADSHTQGDFDNLVATNTLVDYTDIEAMFLAFENMEDPDTGEPVLPSARLQLVTPGALQMTADSIVTATTVEKITNSSNLRTLSGNPLKR